MTHPVNADADCGYTLRRKRAAAGADHTQRMAKPKTLSAPDTRERILDAALALFNAQGTHAVTTRHVASAIGISPGNLYYYFANKEEIVVSLYERIEQQLRATLSPLHGPTGSFDEVLAYLERVFGHLWQFRFFYRDLNTLLQEVPGLRDRYRHLFEATQANARRIFASMVEAGWLEATPNELDMLATNAWILMSHWFMHCQAACRRRTIQSSDVNDGVRHLVALFSPRLKPGQRRQLQRFLGRLR